MRKIQLVSIALLVFLLTAAFAFAEDIAIDSDLSLDQEIQSAIDSIDQPLRMNQAARNAEVSRGHGWINTDNSGFIIAMGLVEKTVIDSSGNEITRGAGNLKVSNGLNYRLNLTQKTSSEMNFEVFRAGSKVGTLSLDKENTYGKISTWTGTLNVNETYQVSLAIDSFPVINKGLNEAKEKIKERQQLHKDLNLTDEERLELRQEAQALRENQGNRPGLFGRMRGWFKGN